MKPTRSAFPLTHFAFLAALVCFVLAAGDAPAQNRYSPTIRVNDKAISAYEIDQRIRLLRVLGAQGDIQREARERLIEERLQVQAAEQLGLTTTEEQLEAGIAEFAARASTTTENFIAVIRNGGVDDDTFRDFIEAGVLWREVVGARFAPQAQVGEDEVDRAIALAGQQSGVRVLVSEIIMLARNGEELAQAQARAVELGQVTSFQRFSAAARQLSASPSRDVGGRLDWLPLSGLPPELRAQFLTMRPGQVTEPFQIPNAIGVFQLRALEERAPERAETVAIDYAEFLIPGGSEADARRIADQIDTCDDLFGIAHGLPDERLTRQSLPPAQLPAPVAAELARLDDGEVSTALVRGNSQVVLMLCTRATEQTADIDRAGVRRALSNQRIASYGAAFLAELRAEAQIIDLQ